MVSKTYTKPKAQAASAFTLSVRQASVADDAWAGLIKAVWRQSGADRGANRFHQPGRPIFTGRGRWTATPSVILNAAVSHPLNLGKPGAPVSLNSGQEIALQPSLDRTGLIVVKINRNTTTLGKAPAGTIPLQVQDRHSYPVSLHSGIATAIAQATPIDAKPCGRAGADGDYRQRGPVGGVPAPRALRACIVSYNTRADLLACLASIVDAAPASRVFGGRGGQRFAGRQRGRRFGRLFRRWR